jgi:hypothetical protein
VNPPASDYSLTRRAAGRRLAAAAGLGALGLAAYVAWSESIPELRVYDGLWMLLWGTIAVGVLAPLVWRWPRERSLLAVVVTAVIGCWAPLVASALRQGIPVMARLKGSWMLAGAGVVGLAAPVGFACLWLALREHRPPEHD